MTTRRVPPMVRTTPEEGGRWPREGSGHIGSITRRRAATRAQPRPAQLQATFQEDTHCAQERRLVLSLYRGIWTRPHDT